MSATMRFRPFACFALLIASAVAVAQDPPAARPNPASDTQRLIAEAQKATTLETNLRTLTDEVGGRVPGTPNMEKAFRWALAAFKQAGADSVTTEEFRMPVGWAEGATRVEVTAPTRFTARAVSIAW